MKAFVFPGQASQFAGMGKSLFEINQTAEERFNEAKEILGYDLADVMVNGSAEDLKQTYVTQPAVFMHSVLTAEANPDEVPSAVAGHSLGEFSALVANKTLTFHQGLELVRVRSEAMQSACEAEPGTMAAIVGLDDQIVEEACADVDGVVIAANYNCPGQLVISGAVPAVEAACEILKEKGARRALILAVGGAFHSPLMRPAEEQLAQAIEAMDFATPICPIYQNVDGKPQTDSAIIKANLVKQLTSPVRWTTTIENMIADGVDHFVEVGGTGKVIQGMIKRIDRSIPSSAL